MIILVLNLKSESLLQKDIKLYEYISGGRPCPKCRDYSVSLLHSVNIHCLFASTEHIILMNSIFRSAVVRIHLTHGSLLGLVA